MKSYDSEVFACTIIACGIQNPKVIPILFIYFSGFIEGMDSTITQIENNIARNQKTKEKTKKR